MIHISVEAKCGSVARLETKVTQQVMYVGAVCNYIFVYSFQINQSINTLIGRLYNKISVASQFCISASSFKVNTRVIGVYIGVRMCCDVGAAHSVDLYQYTTSLCYWPSKYDSDSSDTSKFICVYASDDDHRYVCEVVIVQLFGRNMPCFVCSS